MKKTKLIYLLLIAGTVFWVCIAREYHALLMLMLLLMLPVLLWMQLTYYKKKIEVSININQRNYKKNERAQVELSLKNRSLLPILRVQLKMNFKNQFGGCQHKHVTTAALAARTSRKINFCIQSQYCGRIKIELKELEITDALGLFSIVQSVHKTDELNILPEGHEKEFALFESQKNDEGVGERYSSSKKGNDSSEVFEVRDYKAGDRLQQIHWKLSIKQDKLMTKEYSMPVEDHCLLYIDLNRNDGEKSLKQIDKLLEEVTSLSKYLTRKGLCHHIGWYSEEDGFEKLLIESEEDLLAAQEQLLILRPYKGLAQGLRVYNESGMHFRILYYFVPGDKERVFDNNSESVPDEREGFFDKEEAFKLCS